MWWQCPVAADHVWDTEVATRALHGSGCPFCSGRRTTPAESLEASHPAIAREWCDERNGDLRPSAVRAASGQRVWWRCAHGHEWQTTPAMRTLRGTGCPACSAPGTTRSRSPA